MITGLDHIALCISDMEKSKEFYSRLGFGLEQEYGVDEHGYRVALLEQAGVRIELLEFDEYYDGDQDLRRFDVLGIRHIALRTSNLDNLMDYLSGQSVDFEGPRLTSQGNRQIFVYDPDNIVIEYQEKT